MAGLILQIVATGGAIALQQVSGSLALAMLVYFFAGGIPLWFISLLVFRQHELAALESLDLEELRREKKASGSGEALFDAEGGGGIGFLVAKTRLEWMLRWLVPTFGILTAAYLIAVGIWRWVTLGQIQPHEWPSLIKDKEEVSMVLMALLMLVLFFFARYSTGMARVPKWQLMRGPGSYMFGNSVMLLATIIGFAIVLNQGANAGERVVAFIIPVVMIVLGAEMAINFLLDVYRPRSPGVEPRACYDSRLLGMVAEPGEIAHSLAEAMNYQFGFEVSQTWFYQLLQRTLIPLVVAGFLAVWLLSCIVVVQPYERAIIERFGEQIDPEHPLEPGLYFKWPAPVDIARKYNTGQLHEFYVGFREGDQPDRQKVAEVRAQGAWLEQWTDAQHSGRDHFNFIIAPTPSDQVEVTLDEHADFQPDEMERTAQHLVRMLFVIHYKIDPDRLVDFTQISENPHRLLRRIAWNEVVQYAASNYVDDLLGDARREAGKQLREAIARRADEAKLGLEVVFVGVTNVHPSKEVAESFRKVVNAQQERIAEIRRARVTENETLSRVAGDKRRALALAHALDQVHQTQLRLGELDRALRDLDVPDAAGADVRLQLAEEGNAHLEAGWKYELNQQELDHLRRDFELGLGGSLSALRLGEGGRA